MTTAVAGRLPLLGCSVVDASKRTIGGRNGKKVVRTRLAGDRGRCAGRRRTLVLDSSLTNAWCEWRMSAKVFAQFMPAVGGGEHHGPVVVNDLGGQYEDSFEDVDKHLLDYFTYKAVRTVLAQLFEMNPAQYSWLYSFVVNNKPKDSKVFLQLLVKERQELGERVMVTRLHLFNKWVKKYNHAKLHKAISDENLELLRERLIQTVRFPSSNADDAGKPNIR
ncbi:hypothetical protein MPTK1_2g23580 [Marchantia polymorpha subsp. ruderalis]|uniref:Chaperonin-like RbcX protein n=2 Tax=Marchantia polymorpha TaxID=3197 RepID=A0A176W1C3_MARPO|nr:hypothetical protein AXG93_4360s1180 [Marchantia polymorpha subsp. ruderalis]PTQ35658.1 hypothetical protein MARPO_0069s0007 [Marchantia polymorpha]BBN03453.1 hypothetical protein Mp_2g23580 [Marchantia polymorpha subsp. ruderalis]|eukprot:PTQ35658.1 hypothetical protein MARPO_0069s0007 [Marchantia polymorpha]